MKRIKVMLGTMILGLGMTGAALAQPAPNHDRDANDRAAYSSNSGYVNRGRVDQDDRSAWRGDRDDVYRGGWNAYQYKRGDGDHDRDDRNAGRGDRDARGAWNWGHNNIRRGDRDDR
jgi:hypothetical protein